MPAAAIAVPERVIDRVVSAEIGEVLLGIARIGPDRDQISRPAGLRRRPARIAAGIDFLQAPTAPVVPGIPKISGAIEISEVLLVVVDADEWPEHGDRSFGDAAIVYLLKAPFFGIRTIKRVPDGSAGVAIPDVLLPVIDRHERVADGRWTVGDAAARIDLLKIPAHRLSSTLQSDMHRSVRRIHDAGRVHCTIREEKFDILFSLLR